ncbi:hypothetical protein [Leptospira alexanderi]|uniref:Uncharacterized protein n=1 Tax=Leptospira alexanderi serovar Manhao 3 str. L 60 TaxID=1049759 RepID=V6HXT1_9LEPT|nr:hypothetical protein [Leptospira alexanderi]EQA61832.1 hypothetical protein LEP1GSC062_3222 [Leptospira alexanderi serovar Manhao 3 str. L 60]
MEFYLCLTFITGALSAAFCFFMQRAYSDLISSRPRGKTQGGAGKRAIDAMCEIKSLSKRLALFSETLKFQSTMLNELFEYDENPDYVHIRTELENLIKLVDSKALKYE